MSTKNANRPGYKETPVGWIPNEWECAPLHQVAGINPDTLSESTADDYHFYYIDLSAVKEGHIDFPEEKIIFSNAPSRARRIVKNDDVLLATVRPNLQGFGFASRFPEHVVCSTGFAVIRGKHNFSSEFLFHLLFSNETQNYFERCVTGSNYPALNSSDVANLPIPLPPPPEQRRIAAILSTWDRAIEQTQKLLNACRRRKQGLMQKLLTGAWRFPNFGKPAKNGELPTGWNFLSLSDAAEIIVSNVDKKTNHNEIPVRLCNYTDVYYNPYIRFNMDYMTASASQAEIEKFALKLNDVLITKDSETPDDIAVPALVTDEMPGILCGYHLAILRPNATRLMGAFLNIMLQLQKMRHYFFTLANGVTRFGLSIDAISSACIPIPSLPEQEKIASVLTAVDAEIAALRKSLEKLQLQKRGLMQKLLTGTVRV